MIPLTTAQNTAWRLFLKTYAVLLEQIERTLKQANLPDLSWYDVLWALEEAPDRRLRLHELADALVLQRSNLTRLVDRMEHAGVVQRETCASDRRGAFATITPAGLALRQKMWQVYAQSIHQHFAEPLSEEQVSGLAQAFSLLLKAQS
ncbi:MAG: MarR family winged helix-turn-helix transcriptional regulator [Leptolyngbya sp. BL-A-14]